METNRIEIICKNNNKRIKVLAGTTLSELKLLLEVNMPAPIVGALINNKLNSLETPIYRNKTIEFIDQSSESGLRIYVRSLVFVLYKAVNDLIPNGKLRIEHPVSNGYYCEISSNKQKISSEQLSAIKERMKEIINADIPFVQHYEPTSDIEQLFRDAHNSDCADLLHYKKEYYSVYYTLDGLPDFYPSLLVPSTGQLKVFDICPYFEGFLLQIPKKTNHKELAEIVEQKKMYEIFKEHRQWCRIIGVNNIADVNSIKRSDLNILIKVTEALHEKKIVQIADKIAQNKNIKVVLIAGPSSSGKTTFSKRLSVQLAASGIIPEALSLDNYFINRESTPIDENGEHDFEVIHALDLPYLNSQLEQLINGEEVETPIYNFETGKREAKGKKMQIKEGQVLVIEGIHGLNPELTKTIPDETKFKIYVSALTTLSGNDHNWIPTSDTRILRRIIRDHKYRSYSAENTILRWPSVRRGENKWIFPYQENADAMFNSSLLFEFSAIKKQAEPILMEVGQNSNAYPEARRLLNLLQFFTPISYNDIPATSLLREFLGGSGFRY